MRGVMLLRVSGRIAPSGRKSAPVRIVRKQSKKEREWTDRDCGCLAFVATFLIWSTRKNRSG